MDRETIKTGARSGYKRTRKGVVYVITSDKLIQAVLTGSITAFIFSLNEGVSTYIQRWVVRASGVFVPVKIVAAVGAVLVFIAAYYADQNTEDWREFVRDATGEETSEDTASDEDVTGKEKKGVARCCCSTPAVFSLTRVHICLL